MADMVDDAAVPPLPSGAPIASSTEPSSSSAPPSTPSTSKPPSSSSNPIGAALAAAPAKTDAFITHLWRCLQSRSHADAVLMFICYACGLSGAVLDHASRASLHHTARKLVSMAFQLPPSSTVLLNKTKPAAPPLAVPALKLAARLKAMAGLLSEMRTMGRLLGLFGLYMAARGFITQIIAAARARPSEKADSATETKTSSDKRFDALVAAAQLVALISFQVNENLAFLGSKKVLGLSPLRLKQMARLSVRSWAVYIGLELGKLLVERGRKTGTPEAKDETWAAQWRKNFGTTLAWAPLTVHWSVDNGPLHEIVVGLLAIIPATVGVVDVWRQNA